MRRGRMVGENAKEALSPDNSRRQIIVFFDAQHPHIAHGRRKPAKLALERLHREHAGHGVDDLISEIRAALLPIKAFGFRGAPNVLIGAPPMFIGANLFKRLGI